MTLDFRPTLACLAAMALFTVVEADARGKLPANAYHDACVCLWELNFGRSGPICITCDEAASFTELELTERGFV